MSRGKAGLRSRREWEWEWGWWKQREEKVWFISGERAAYLYTLGEVGGLKIDAPPVPRNVFVSMLPEETGHQALWLAEGAVTLGRHPGDENKDI